MNNRSMFYIFPLLGLAALPQLIFFWLAPAVDCATAVYCFGSIGTVIHLALCFILWLKYGLRKTAAVTAVGSALWLVLLAGCGLLLGLAASIRAAVFALAIICTVYMICLVPLICSISPMTDRHRPARSQGVIEEDFPSGRAYAPADESMFSQKMPVQPPVRPASSESGPPPLPPRY